VTTLTDCNPVLNDPVIRQLAILSQMAVFKDIIPGYRIRALTESEKTEKVSQMVARTRDWEQGLVYAYQTYMRLLEGELKGSYLQPRETITTNNHSSAKTELADIALHCMCKLLVEATHFNFRTNLMTCIVSYLSKKSWDKVCTLKCIFFAPIYGSKGFRNVLSEFDHRVSSRSFRCPFLRDCSAIK
jgi:nucleolar complex protein 3